uniref:Uncharacterized protein n=2 Tax=Avena sativa TaxID=4498 RepID=A0ACD5T7B1_AVESA
MRIRRCASRLLGSDYSSTAPPPFQLPLPPPFELPLPTPTPPPPPVLQPCSSAKAGGAGGLSASSAEPPCGDNRSPWDLMAQLDPSDPKELELFTETYFVSVAYRASWLFPTTMPAARIKEEEEEYEEEVGMAVDMVDYVNDMPWHKVAKKKATKRTFTENRDEEKYASRPKKKSKVKTEDDEEDGMDVGGELWMCKKNDGKTWFCRRTVSQPDSYCSYHSEPKRVPHRPPSTAASRPSGSSKPRGRRALDVGEGFYYYAGFGPSRSKRQSRPSSSVMESPPAEVKEEASSEEKEEALPEEKEEAPSEQKVLAPPEEHADITTAQPQADDADHQVASARIDELVCDDMTGIAGCDEESSDDALCWNSEPRVVGVNGGIKRKSPFKKKWRKPVKARSLKSLMT